MTEQGRKRLNRTVREEALRVCACTNFRKAARVVSRLFDEYLQPCGLRGTQLALLLEISLDDKPTVPRLARSMVAEGSSISRNLQPLIKRGFITTHRGVGHRAQTLTLTPQGWTVLEQAVPLWKSAQTTVVNLIGLKQWPRLLADLTQVTQRRH